MTPERWQQIEEIFHAALELSPEHREEFVRERSGDDDELHSEVENLLSQFDEASSFIEQPLYDSAKSGVLSALLDDSDDDPMIGSVLGSYRIEREIGRGGMGAVYEAVRADGEFRLRAAVKVVKRGVDTDFVLRRFRNERQILATLEHPYITRLIDGGTTDDGRPYFVMDYVDGLPLYRYCDQNRLSIRDRLSLFCRVCEAVEYAHTKLVIHRDLKPSNIFVTDEGSPRLLDFGIAKLLDPELASDTFQPTATALRMMTVDYASPEQVHGEKVTFATDVYSLGVILFELLTGHRPYRLKSRNPHEVARAICDDQPTAPSRALTGPEPLVGKFDVENGESHHARVADLRSDTLVHLREQLLGDLDRITLRALRKDPAERHPSIKALREDIEKYLRGESVNIPLFFPFRSTETTLESGKETRLLAVLPLTLMNPLQSGNTDETYLTIGLADAMITRLASVKRLTVRPTSSITQFSEPETNPFRAGQELGVDFVLDGRIRRFADRIRVSLQLLDVRNGTAIWAKQFDERMNDVLELEDAIAESVATTLIPHLTGEDKRKLAKRGTNDPRAFDAYLKGRVYWNQFTPDSLPKAIEAFEEAIRIDPDYALAYVGVADFYIWANIYGLLPTRESFRHARAAAERALEIDDQLPEAYASIALGLANQYEFDEAERLYRYSIDLSPNYALTHEWYSALLIGTGRFREGLAESRRTVELDPRSLRTKTLATWANYQARQFEAALAMADEIIAADPTYPQGYLQRGYALCELGRADEAVVDLKRCAGMMPGSPLAQFSLAFAYAAAGLTKDAAAVAADLKERASREYVKPMFIGLACAAAGETDEAIKYLGEAVDERDPWTIWLGTDAKLDRLRDEPGFKELFLRTGNPLATGEPAARITGPTSQTSIGYADANTISAAEMPTLRYRPGFLRRNYGKLTAAALVLVGLIAGYATGILTFSFTGGPSVVTTSQAPASRSIVVLPFENATGDPANDYLCDGMSENLINRMSGLRDLRIISRSTSFRYKDKQADPRSVGKELGVDSVLVGSLNRQGDQFVVKTELLNVADGMRVFALDFFERPDRIYALQNDIAAKVIAKLNVPGTRPIEQASYTENNEAFELYLKGEYHRQKGTPADTTTSIELYERALQLDPNYALAYQGLAMAYRSAPAYGSLSPHEAYPKAREAAEKALTIDPSLSTAYVSLASIKATYDWDFAGAEQEYKRAIQLGPNNAEAHYSYGNFLVAMARTDEALAEYRIGQQIDPLSLNVPTNVGWAMYISGHNDEAIAEIRKVIARDPTFARAYMSLGEILEEQGKYDEAIAALQKAKELSRDPLVDMAIGHTMASAGRWAEATKIAADLEDKVRRKEVSPFLPAVVYAGLNEKDKAFYWLERAYQERSNWLTLIKVGRRLKNLRDDPRFDDLLKRVGFETRRI